MADDNSGLMKEFEEFLSAKRQKEQEEADSEDYEIEVWDKDGRGARIRRSHAKPFLQSLGIDLDPDTSGENDDKGNGGKGGDSGKRDGKPASGKRPDAAPGGTARKYFSSQPKK